MLHRSIARRSLLKGLGLGGLALLSSKTYASSMVLREHTSAISLNFLHLHTNQRAEAEVWKNGDFVEPETKRLDDFLGDFRSGESTTMDKALYLQLALIQKQLGGEQEFQIISAYRSPATNEALRKRGGGVAKKSFHMTGQALDIRVPDAKLSQLREAAMSLKAGGVGYYPRSGFIHIDTGPHRQWRG